MLVYTSVTDAGEAIDPAVSSKYRLVAVTVIRIEFAAGGVPAAHDVVVRSSVKVIVWPIVPASRDKFGQVPPLISNPTSS